MRGVVVGMLALLRGIALFERIFPNEESRIVNEAPKYRARKSLAPCIVNRAALFSNLFIHAYKSAGLVVKKYRDAGFWMLDTGCWMADQFLYPETSIQKPASSICHHKQNGKDLPDAS